MPQIDRKELERTTEQICEIMASEEYLQQIEKVHECEDRKMVAASKHLTTGALREAGVDLPEDARISSRYFEPDFAVDVGDAQEGPNVVNVLNQRHPGLLDRLKREHPDLFEEIAEAESFGVPDPGPAALCACAGGSDSGCGGIGL